MSSKKRLFLIKIISISVLSFFLISCASLPNNSPKIQSSFNLVDYDDSGVLKLVDVKLDVEVRGNAASTRVTYEILNQGDDEIEAMFLLALPASAKVTGYGLDINGVMVDGVMVPKEKARYTFNEIEDEDIDPGIAEVINGNRFQTEIYPVLPNKTRSVYVEYIETLSSDSRGRKRYRFPFSDHPAQTNLTFNIQVSGVKEVPTIHSIPISRGKAIFKQGGKHSFSLSAEKKTDQTNKKYRDLDFSTKPYMASRLELAQANNGKTYFSFAIPVKRSNRKIKSLNNTNIFWDVSSSMSGYHSRYRSMLKKLLKNRNMNSLTITPFSNEVNEPFVFTRKNHSDNDILEWVDRLKYDGGTRLNSIYSIIKSNQDAEVIIFSDGVESLGKLIEVEQGKNKTLAPLSFPFPPINFVSVGHSVNLPLIKSMVRKSNGTHIDLNIVTYSHAVDLIGTGLPKFELTSSMVDGVRYMTKEFIPSTANIVVSGEVGDRNNELKIYLNGQESKVVKFSELPIVESELAKHQWASFHLENLLVDPIVNQEGIIDFSRKHNIVTPFTSLLVLENLWQYAEYDIDPPEVFRKQKDFEEEWNEIVLELADEQTPNEQSYMEDLTELWNDRVSWWNSQKRLSLKDAMDVFNSQRKKSVKPEHEEVIVTGIRASRERSAEVQRDVSLLSDMITAEDIGGALPDESIVDALQRMPNVRVDESLSKTKIALTKGISSASYIKLLNRADRMDYEYTYFELKKIFGEKPIFYIDCAQFFFEKKQRGIASRILSNVLELDIEIADIRRMVAHSYAQMGLFEEAIAIFENLKLLLPFEINSYRDLALAWQKYAQDRGDFSAYEKSKNYYVDAILSSREMDADMETVITVILELNNFLAKTNGIDKKDINLDRGLLIPLDLDLRVSLSWNNRATDIDLWVIEPTGEKVFYRNKTSITGALIPFDNTESYGPEEYLNRYAIPGEYVIKVKYFSSRTVELLGPTALSLTIYSDFGKPSEQIKTTTVQLTGEGETVEVGRFIVH